METTASEFVSKLSKKIDRKSFIEKWVKNLESNRYKQTKQTLRDEDGHCCLGVACATAQGVVGGSSYWTSLYGNGSFVDFPEAKLAPELGKFIFGKNHNNIQKALMHMNDTKGKSFKEIAAVIRKEVLSPEGKWYIGDK